MRCDVVLMGFAVYSTSGDFEYSFGFEGQAIQDLQYFSDPNYKWGGHVNTGAYTCEKRNVGEPYSHLDKHIRYQSSKFEGINRYTRLPSTQKLAGSRGGSVYPTIALVYQTGSTTLLGFIEFPDQPWSSFKEEFVANLNFFLHPLDNRYAQIDPQFKSGCRPPYKSRIHALDFEPLEKECSYQLEKIGKK